MAGTTEVFCSSQSQVARVRNESCLGDNRVPMVAAEASACDLRVEEWEA
jgi:hypothetical protein